ncbi:MAG: type I secretion system permease/ATPase [Magnetococcales bacterium]|nr:type I secretion system permease/ATPase [Magnetococcales bacterium]
MSDTSLEACSPPVLPPPSARVDDALLACLAIVMRLLGQPASAVSLAHGLPLPEGGLTPALFLRAAGRAGMAARLVEIPWREIQTALLPCVLLLERGRAAVLLSREPDDAARLIFPESDPGYVVVSGAELDAEVTGRALFTRPRHRESPPESDDVQPAGNRWFWPEILAQKSIIAQVFLSSLFINFLALAVPLYVMSVYDRVIPNQAVESLWVLTLGVGVALLFDFLLRALRYHFINVTGRNLDTILASRIFAKVLRLPLASLRSTPGQMANRIRSFDILRDFFSSATLATFVDLPFVVVFLLTIAWLSGPMLALIPLMATVLMVVLGVVMLWPGRERSFRHDRDTGNRQGFLVEVLHRLETVKVLGLEGRMRHRWEMLVDSQAVDAARERSDPTLYLFLVGLMSSAAYVGMVIMGVYYIMAGQMTTGGLVACSLLSGRIMQPLSQIAAVFIRWQQARVALAALDDLVRIPDERPANLTPVPRDPPVGNIEFRQVMFRYPDQVEPALRGVSFTIREGERVGIIGPYGSGKSTILALILGLYEPQGGAVMVEGLDVRQWHLADLRQGIGHVPQGNGLFTGSIRENIAMGTGRATDREIFQALAVTGFDVTVRRHPLGLDRQVGTEGAALSGGEKQALLIARSLVGGRRLLLFDEATSAMDRGAEQSFVQQLHRCLEGRTVLAVTQRPAMLALMDRILVIREGLVVGDGPQKEILAMLAAAENRS